MTAIEIPQPAPPVPRAPAAAARDSFPRRLRDAVLRAYPDRPDALALVREFLAPGNVRSDRAFTARLIDVGRGTHGEDWPLRLLAARMLESRILAMSPADLRAHRAIFDTLGVDFDPRDGYTAADERTRVAQFRARLSRFAHLHHALDGTRTMPRALERFLDSARRPCLVAAARYLFTLDETLERIYGKTRQSQGLRDRDCDDPRAAQLALDTLPVREAELARALFATHEIFWVGQDTPSDFNSLLEFPLGTVALVIKPPGSGVELELKRAGIRGPRVWDVLYTRDSSPVCSSHYLQGGAVGSMLEMQSKAEAKFAAIWRLVHGGDAPVSRTLRVNNVFKLPLSEGDGGGTVNILRYFTDPALYGAGYARMRRDMALALDAMLRFEGEPPYHAPNDYALTARFFAAVKPGQALQIGTSSFRLDCIAHYLQPDGARNYQMKAGLPCDPRRERLFADEVLSEILVDYVPPRAHSRTYAGYLRAAFAVPENRRRADRNFLSCVEQIGKMFGTCVALCIGSGGESYVPRNVGLRNVFVDGQWTLRVIFMDHDALNIPEYNDRDIYPQVAARMMWFDYVHIAGGRIDPARVRGSLRLLAGIFRVSPALRRAGMAAFHRAVEQAHRVTREALPEKLLPYFHPKWGERLEDFDQAVRTYVRAGRSTRAWAATIPTLLEKRRQTTRSLISQYIRGIGAFGRMWRNLPYLLKPNGGSNAQPAPPAD
jgi:hypothetical protein